MVYVWRKAAGAVVCALLAGAGPAAAQCLSTRGAGAAAQGAAIGGALGAILGGANSHSHRGRAQGQGALIGGFLGAGVGCWTAHEQWVVAAREQALRANTDQLNQIADNLERYNNELAAKVAAARQTNAQLRASSNEAYGANSRLAAQAQSERNDALQQLAQVNASMQALDASARGMDRRSANFAALQRQYDALNGARAKLEEIANVLG